MKKLVASALILLMILSAASLTVFATSNTGRTGIVFDRAKTNEVSHSVGYYYSDKRLEKIYLDELEGIVISKFEENNINL